MSNHVQILRIPQHWQIQLIQDNDDNGNNSNMMMMMMMMMMMKIINSAFSHVYSFFFKIAETT